MERFLNEVQEFVQRCLDGQNSSNVTVIMNESYYERGYDDEDKHFTIRTRDVSKELDNDKDLDYFYCQEHINKKRFSCGAIIVLNELKKICPNIQTTTVEKLCDKFNKTLDFSYKLNWFGVIYVEE